MGRYQTAQLSAAILLCVACSNEAATGDAGATGHEASGHAGDSAHAPGTAAQGARAGQGAASTAAPEQPGSAPGAAGSGASTKGSSAANGGSSAAAAPTDDAQPASAGSAAAAPAQHATNATQGSAAPASNATAGGAAPATNAGAGSPAGATAGSAAPASDAGTAANGGTTVPGANIPPSSMRGNALSDAYAALTRGDRASLATIVPAIDAQVQAQPDNPYAVFYAGAFRLWQLSEALDITTAPGVLDNLGRAHELLPDDFRVTGFFGLSQVIIGGFGDDQLLQAGLKTLATGVEQQSTYGHFLRATAVSTLPATHPAFQTAYSDMTGVGPDCKVNIDAEGVYHYPTAEDPTRSRICTNDGIVPHAWEGYFTSFGDIALKSGKTAAEARALYKSAETAPTYASWPFKRDLEQRIANVEQAAASGSAATWALDGKICVGCHQKE